MNRHFNITYNNQIIMVNASGFYLLNFSDGRWIVLERQAGIPEWHIKDISVKDWITEDRVQEIGELLARKEDELHKDGDNKAAG